MTPDEKTAEDPFSQPSGAGPEYRMETRPCKQCVYFSDRGMGHPKVCALKWMHVVPDMLVTFKASEGTCFT